MNEKYCRQTICSFKKNIVLYFIIKNFLIELCVCVCVCVNSRMLISQQNLSIVSDHQCYHRSWKHCSLPFARNDLGRDVVLHRHINSNKDMSGLFNE